MASESLVLEDLPMEVLEHILSYLLLSDRKNASLVCHVWNELAFSRRVLCKISLCLGTGWDQSLIDCFQNSSRCYRKVYVDFGYGPCYDFVFGLIIKVLKIFGAELESFHSQSYCTKKQLEQLLVLVPNLKQLNVRLDSDTLQQQITIPVLRHLKDLTSLKNVLQVQSLHAPNLTQLSANFFEKSDAEGSFAFLKQISSQLKRLHLFATKYFIPIAELKFPNVEILHLEGQICAASDDALRSFFSGFRCLTEVKLDFHINGLVLDDITVACPAIEILYFRNHNLESDHFIGSLLERLKHLRKLSITGTIRFRSNINFKPLVSVKRYSIELLSEEASIFEDFRKLLPNVVTDVSVIATEYSIPEWLLGLVCRNFPRLKRLATIADVLQQLDQLEELALTSISNPVTFMVWNQSLKRLYVMDLPLFTDADLLELADHYPSLEELMLSCCKKVTFWGVDEFKSRRTKCFVHNGQYRF